MVLAGLVGGCASSSTLSSASSSTNLAAPPNAAEAGPRTEYKSYSVMPSDATVRPPRLTVGTSYPDTPLILPWFLNDVINLVNYY